MFSQNLKLARRLLSDNIAFKRKRLRYQSQKRGTLENCWILSTYAEEHLDKMNNEELDAFDQLINAASNEWDLYKRVVNCGTDQDKGPYCPLIKDISDFIKNKQEENVTS